MSNPRLPQETIDHILDILHDKPETLKVCCLVSKSWIPRTRKHLFGDTKFFSVGHLELWKKSFPDPANSPAIHTHTLTICCTAAVLAAAFRTPPPPPPAGFIRTFLHFFGWESKKPKPATQLIDYLGTSLVQFYGFSPPLRSLRLNSLILPCSELFNLVLSFPLLEDLTLSGHESSDQDGDPHGSQNINPATSPLFTGTLDLSIPGRIGHTSRWLLDLPNGLHFRELVFPWFHEEDSRWMTELLVGCSGTLEHVDIGQNCIYMLSSAPALTTLTHLRLQANIILS